MNLDAVDLARLQFALTIMFHYLFPPLTIGLGVLLVFFEGMYLKTNDIRYEMLARFWTKIFAVNFAIGTASGIVMEFQFGTNWAAYSRYVGDVFGSALAAEGIFAFFLESGFLAVLVFGWDKVSPKMHFFSTVMVALGSIFSAVWIVVANSWQQTPGVVGETFNIANGRAEIVDFWKVVFNPSSMHRLVHVLLGAFIMGAFFVMSVMAWYILHGRCVDLAKKAFAVALIFGALSSVLILGSGDLQARQVAKTQPPKLAACEGVFRTEEATPLYLFGVPDAEAQRVKWGIGVPGALSFLVHHDFKTPVMGLDKVKPEDRPPVGVPFQTYHLMIALGMFFLALTFGGLFFLWRGTLYEKRWLLWLFVFAVITPVIANQAGWIAAEVGRQPWVVYGLLRTRDAVSRNVSAAQIGASLAMFVFLYGLLFLVWLYVVDHKIKRGPDEELHMPEKTTAEGLLAAARGLAGKGGSMTEARNGQ
jgi:cytochrome d ubiquinol oxidase subunit I